MSINIEPLAGSGAAMQSTPVEGNVAPNFSMNENELMASNVGEAFVKCPELKRSFLQHMARAMIRDCQKGQERALKILKEARQA